MPTAIKRNLDGTSYLSTGYAPSYASLVRGCHSATDAVGWRLPAAQPAELFTCDALVGNEAAESEKHFPRFGLNVRFGARPREVL